MSYFYFTIFEQFKIEVYFVISLKSYKITAVLGIHRFYKCAREVEEWVILFISKFFMHLSK